MELSAAQRLDGHEVKTEQLLLLSLVLLCSSRAKLPRDGLPANPERDRVPEYFVIRLNETTTIK